MSIQVPCVCGHTLSVDEVLAGHSVTCNQCNRVHQVPAGAPAQPAQAGGYPQQAGGYPQQAGGYPQQAGGYPQQAGGYPPAGPAGYGAPGAYPGVRPKGPSRWALITGGIFAYIACLLWGAVGIVVLGDDDISSRSFSSMTSKQQFQYIMVVVGTLGCIVCLVSASVGFAAKTWAAWITAGVLGFLTVVNIYGMIDTHGTDNFGAFIFFAVPTLLAFAFSVLGVKQARAITAFKAGQASG